MNGCIDKKQIKHIADEVVRQSQAVIGDRLVKAVLFGSHARGDADAESDIDIFLLVDISPDGLPAFRSAIAKTASRVSLEAKECTTVAVVMQDVQTYDKYKAALPFFENIDQEGIVLYVA
jgi:predicted nucleotidyltransferase